MSDEGEDIKNREIGEDAAEAEPASAPEAGAGGPEKTADKDGAPPQRAERTDEEATDQDPGKPPEKEQAPLLKDEKNESAAQRQPPGKVRVVGVKFRRAGKDYFFSAGTLRFHIGDRVIVETDRGLGLARVVTPVFELEGERVPKNFKKVIRKANWNDLERDRKNKEREREAFELCIKFLDSRNLNMKLVQVDYLHDASKAIFYFTAEQRVDFRDLVKDLARELHTRIEMRQIGVRDEAKIAGGIGPCGRVCCCTTFLTDFSPVSVRMAKDQNLAMNPTKVSGLCGRLMCCLAYEHPLYRENCKHMPKKGKRMMSTHGPCKVIDLNILAKKVLVELESGKTIFVNVQDLKPLEQAQKEMAGVGQRDEDTEVFNDEMLESDDPKVLERMGFGDAAPAATGRKPGESRNKPGQPARRQQGKPQREKPGSAPKEKASHRREGSERAARQAPGQINRQQMKPGAQPGKDAAADSRENQQKKPETAGEPGEKQPKKRRRRRRRKKK